MNKKIICSIVCTLLITTAAVPITGYVLNNIMYKSGHDRGFVYVDDDQDPGWYDEFHVKTIQEGINNASTGDTVFVYDGQYNENVIVNKTVDLEGNDRDNTIIHGVNGSDNTVLVTSNWCNISEFTIENGGSLSGGIKVMADHCTIFDSIIDDNTDIGIFVQSSDYTFIHDNSFTENNQGIYLYQSDHTTISLNDIMNNYVNGILSLFSDYNDILSNSIKSNSRVGIWLNNDCDENTINNNTVISNGEEGIRLWLSDDNTISENTVSENGAPDEDGGIVCYESNNNDIFDNIINSNENQGIFIENSNSNEVFRNCIFDNNMYGINCENSNNNILYHNNIFNNTQNAKDDSTNTNTWHNTMLEQGNYWDDYTGQDSDGDGIGDSPYEIPGGNNEDEYPLMTMYGPPHADFTHEVDGRNVTFNASRSYDYDGYIDDYAWEFGDDTSGNGKIVEHTYPDDGTYNVTLTVTDNDGKNDTTIKSIVVDSIPPEIIDNSPDFGTTGDIFTFNATVTDNVEVGLVQAGYKFGEGPQKKINMVNVAGDYWEASIIINHSLDILQYFIYAEDTFGNGNCSETKNVTIYDNDPPEISNVIADPPVAPVGYNVNISAVVTDNIELVEVNLHIVYPDSSVQNFSIIHNKIGDTYFSDRTYTDDGTYKYHIWAKDSSNVQNVSDVKEFNIVLGSPPENPQIRGPNGGKPRTNYTFELQT